LSEFERLLVVFSTAGVVGVLWFMAGPVVALLGGVVWLLLPNAPDPRKKAKNQVTQTVLVEQLYTCPFCGIRDLHRWQPFCHGCGKKMSWAVEKNA